MFEDVAILESVTKIAIKESPKMLRTLGLPIPNRISGKFPTDPKAKLYLAIV